MRDPALFHAPHPLSSRRIAIVAAAAMGAVLAHPVLAGVEEVTRHTKGPFAWTAVTVCTALVAALHVAFSSRAASDLGVVVRCVTAGVVLGILDSGLSLSAVVTLHEGLSLERAFGSFMLGSIFGSIVGGSRGLLFGLAFIPLVMLAVEHHRRPSHEGRDVALMAGGTSLLLAAMLAQVMLSEAMITQLAAAAIGLGAAGVGWIGLLRRRRFLADVMRGARPGWAMRAEDPTLPGAERLFPASRAGLADAMLCRCHDEGASPYRASAVWVPVARVASTLYPAPPA